MAGGDAFGTKLFGSFKDRDNYQAAHYMSLDPLII